MRDWRALSSTIEFIPNFRAGESDLRMDLMMPEKSC
jgi:hypothetical protein